MSIPPPRVNRDLVDNASIPRNGVVSLRYVPKHYSPAFQGAGIVAIFEKGIADRLFSFLEKKTVKTPRVPARKLRRHGIAALSAFL